MAGCAASVVIGARGNETVRLNCGACGYGTCTERVKACQKDTTGHTVFFWARLSNQDDRP